MKDQARLAGTLSLKLIACVAVLACLALGIIGLFLPLIPGLIFLALAAVILARLFPSVGRRLRRSEAFGTHFDWANTFMDLNIRDKLRLAGLMTVKLVIDGVAAVSNAVSNRISGGRRIAR